MSTNSPASPSNRENLISISPADSLRFSIGRGAEARDTLCITNTSDKKIVFKVKTTHQAWYFVRPSQDILDAGQSKNVEILVVEAESSRFLEQEGQTDAAAEKLDKHRFLIQSKTISDAEYDSVAAASSAQRAELFARIWETGDKEDRKSFKVKVTYNILEPVIDENNAASSSSSSSAAAASSQSYHGNASAETVENQRIVQSRVDKIMTSLASGNTSDAMPESEEAIFAELQALRKKFDAVVEYTVYLTAERDTIVANLEEAKRELSRRKAAEAATSAGKDKNGGGGSGSDRKAGDGKNGSTSDKIKQRNADLPVTSFLLMIIALVMYSLGRFYR